MATPAQLGRYQVLALIGQGAMGAVYKARDPAIDRLVAVKTVGGAITGWAEHEEEFLERFRREARAAGRLSHPHIVSVYDLDVDEATQTPFIVMEYVAGVSLATVLKENPVPVDQALGIVEQIGSALAEAHHHGVIHRDIKPANIFFDQRGRVKVGDFGIAHLEGSELTQPGVGLGTPGYLAPEMLRGEAADARTDLYALGVVAYQLLTGKKPFERGRLEGDVDPPHVVRAEIPEGVSRAVMRCLATSPDDRPGSVEAFLRELRPAPAPGPQPTITVVIPVRGRRRGLLALGLALAGLLALAGFLLFRGGPRSAPPSPSPAAAPVTRAVASPTPRRTPTAAPPPRAASPPAHLVLPPAWDHGKEGDREDEEDKRKEPGHGKGHAKGKKKEH